MNEQSKQALSKKRRAVQARRVVLVFGALALLLGGLVGVKWIASRKEAKPDTLKPPLVSQVKIVEKTYKIHIVTRGVVKPFEDVILTAQVAGRIDKRLKVGDKVAGFVFRDPTASKKGVEPGRDAVIATIEDIDYRQRVATALTKVQAAKREYDWNKSLYESPGEAGKVISLSEYKRSEDQKVLSEIDLVSARIDLQRTRIVCPFNGVVAERYVERGDTVALGTRIARVVNLSKVKIVVGLTSDEIVRLRRASKKGEPLTTTVRVLDVDQDFKGTVHTIGSAADAIGTYPVEILVDNPKGVLLVDMSATDVRILIGERTAIAIPRTALFQALGGETYVFVLNSANAARRNVVLGSEPLGDESLAVVKGNSLKVGEFLIVPIERNVVAGKPVEIVKKPKKGDGKTKP